MSYLTIKLGAWVITGLAAFTLLWGASKPSDSRPAIHGQITTILNSVVPPPLTTDTMPTVKGCAEYVADAITVGFPASETQTITRIIMRESGCNPLAFNREDSNGGSRGLFQINGIWCNKSKAWPNGWLQAKGIITSCKQLLDPERNTISALAIWQHSGGWSPWNLPMLP